MVTQGVADAIIILVVGVIAIQGVWLSLITYQMLRNLRRRRRKTEGTETRETYVEEVFLLQRSGTLLRHLTRRLKPYADSDILSGMLRAVQEFIRDAFKGESGVFPMKAIAADRDLSARNPAGYGQRSALRYPHRPKRT